MPINLTIQRISDDYQKVIIEHNLPMSFTIKDLKLLIFKHYGLSMNFQVYYFKNKKLKDNTKLHEYSNPDGEVRLQMCYDIGSDDEILERNLININSPVTLVRKEENLNLNFDSNLGDDIDLVQKVKKIPVTEEVKFTSIKRKRPQSQFKPDAAQLMKLFDESKYKVSVKDFKKSKSDSCSRKLNEKTKALGGIIDNFLSHMTQGDISEKLVFISPSDEPSEVKNETNYIQTPEDLVNELLDNRTIINSVKSSNENQSQLKGDEEEEGIDINKIETICPELETSLIKNEERGIHLDDNIDLIREVIAKDFMCLVENNSANSATNLTQFFDKIKLFQLNDTFINTHEKINLVLDIDSTLIYSKVVFDFNEAEKFNDSQDLFQKEINYDNKKALISFKFRKNIDEFFARTKTFCNFYICSLAFTKYARAIAQTIVEKFNVEIPPERVMGIKYQSKKFKTLNDFSINPQFLNHAIIFDDRCDVWREDKFSFRYVISSMAYVNFFYLPRKNVLSSFDVKEFFPFFLNISDNPKSLNQVHTLSIFDNYYHDEKNVPYHVECERSRKFQLDYLSGTIELVYKLVSFTQCNISFILIGNTALAINFIRSNVFAGVRVSLDYACLANDLARENCEMIIRTLGGRIVRGKCTNATHFITSKNRKYNLDQDIQNSKWNTGETIFMVNLKFVFHSYYFMTKVNEYDPEYSELLE